MSTLLPQYVLDSSGWPNKSCDDFVRGEDILDIWFDSGSTWKTVVEAQTGSVTHGIDTLAKKGNGQKIDAYSRSSLSPPRFSSV